jgi:chemotaxis methyl-accepting protein methylase
MRRRYFAPTPPFTIVPEVRRMVRFERRDLLAEAAPPGSHHLICCRNVLIYFDRETQERLFQKYRDALAPSGFLVLGKVETLLGEARNRFAAVDGRERIFRPQ